MQGGSNRPIRIGPFSLSRQTCLILLVGSLALVVILVISGSVIIGLINSRPVEQQQTFADDTEEKTQVASAPLFTAQDLPWNVEPAYFQTFDEPGSIPTGYPVFYGPSPYPLDAGFEPTWRARVTIYESSWLPPNNFLIRDTQITTDEQVGSNRVLRIETSILGVFPGAAGSQETDYLTHFRLRLANQSEPQQLTPIDRVLADRQWHTLVIRQAGQTAFIELDSQQLSQQPLLNWITPQLFLADFYLQPNQVFEIDDLYIWRQT